VLSEPIATEVVKTLVSLVLLGVGWLSLVDAHLGHEWDQYSLTVFAKNLFDEEYGISKTAGVIPKATAGDDQLFGVPLRGTF